MTPYIRNKNCGCTRCRAHGYMPAAVVITVGILMLLENTHAIPMHKSMPVLLLVIGCVLLVARTGSTEGHVQPGWIEGAPVPPQQTWTQGNVQQTPQQWTTGFVPPPPSSNNPTDSQVKP